MVAAELGESVAAAVDGARGDGEKGKGGVECGVAL